MSGPAGGSGRDGDASEALENGRRFWSKVDVAPADGAFAVRLDERPLRTPARAALNVPTRAFAEAVAAEWREVDGKVRPGSMPFTRAANAAIDRVAPLAAQVVEHLVAYGRSDLLCHRAEAPEELRRRQATSWDPPLAWAAEALGVRLEIVEGVMPHAQPERSVAALRSAIAGEGPFALTALSELTSLSGSVVLALATARGALAPIAAWDASQVDEAWQEEQWGADALATQARTRAQTDFLRAARMIALLAEEPSDARSR